jgi:hypothetical protein
MANNPGPCRLSELARRCARGDERERVNCFLDAFVENNCRNGRAGAQRRANAIRAAFRNEELQRQAFSTPTSLEAVITRCTGGSSQGP